MTKHMSANLAHNTSYRALPRPRLSSAVLDLQLLSNDDATEVQAFLSFRPIHTVFLSSMIRDNGIESPLNRGSFYGCRDSLGTLQGVALIGHATLVEARCAGALRLFAKLTRETNSAKMIMGELSTMEEFSDSYITEETAPRLACRELLFEQSWPVQVQAGVPDLRLATLEDLELIMPVHAAIAESESGVNPLQSDPVGFRNRCARRIEQERVWVVVRDGRLVFKADVQCESEQVAYLEGIYVAPEDRGNGVGLSCLSQMGRELLNRVNSICLLANETNTAAHSLYKRAGYKLRSVYDTLFL
jgi:predicted GNAT family acetyltransferase